MGQTLGGGGLAGGCSKPKPQRKSRWGEQVGSALGVRRVGEGWKDYVQLKDSQYFSELWGEPQYKQQVTTGTGMFNV